MSRHWDKEIRDTQAAVAEVGAPKPRTEPMSRSEVESFVKGFGMSAVATRRMVDAWMADQGLARSRGYDERGWDDSPYYNPY